MKRRKDEKKKGRVELKLEVGPRKLYIVCTWI